MWSIQRLAASVSDVYIGFVLFCLWKEKAEDDDGEWKRETRSNSKPEFETNHVCVVNALKQNTD